jgi:predicted transposase YdaD
MAKAIADGAHNQLLEIAQNMLDSSFDLEMISKLTGLSPDEIESLR